MKTLRNWRITYTVVQGGVYARKSQVIKMQETLPQALYVFQAQHRTKGDLPYIFIKKIGVVVPKKVTINI